MFMNTKKDFRDFYFKIRKCINDSERQEFDRCIFVSFVNSNFFKNFEIFLIYISFNNEVQTLDLIRFMLDNNKKVAVPFCNDKTMDFYFINSFDELVDGKYGIRSVDVEKSVKVVNFDNALCIVPAVSFDNNGNRLGYGGGYYDRFLSENKIPSVGFCYQRCICDKLPTEQTDIKINFVLTENQLWNHEN